MGEPANLPDFRGLTKAIGEGTGIEKLAEETEDHYLGRLMDRGVNVHDLAVHRLSRDGQRFTVLHHDLLRLSPVGNSPRIVTTNFDLLFEQAAKELYSSEPDVFRARALPLGREFDGIVHVHGALDYPGEMVLTDKEFGRAYLTDGQARRFLLELFRSFSVLFVGYSHNDTVMNYLARALPLEETEYRFALTDECDSERWRFLGIEPVHYPNPDGTHKALCSGVAGLAEIVSRGVLEWQQWIAAIASVRPSLLVDEETDLIEDGFTNATRTRFFTDTASDSEWIDWLDRRGYLAQLFGSDDLLEHNKGLGNWLAEEFAIRDSASLFRLIGRHHMRLHPEFWCQLGGTVGWAKDQPITTSILDQWVSLLIDTVPQTLRRNMVSTVLYQLSEQCNKYGLTNRLVDIFGALSSSRLELSRRNESLEPVLPGEHYEMSEIWEKGLKPDLDSLAEPLFAILIENLTKLHAAQSTWGEDNHRWDWTSLSRSAIEPHDQDNYQEPVDIVIDAARDCLEHLASHQPGKTAYWCDLLVASDAPMLRRLAVHILAKRNNMSADQKIDWLLAKAGLDDDATHHETFQALRSIYPAAIDEGRQAIVDAVTSFRWPDENNKDKERLTARHHFRWLNWLFEADPDCAISKGALDSVLARYPDFRPEEHPDFRARISGGFLTPTSPWSVRDLLSKPAGEWLDDLLSFQGADSFGADRTGLASSLNEAASQNFNWGIELADALGASDNWDSDLWPPLLRAWSRELDENKHGQVLDRICQPELLAIHVRAVADVLYELVARGGMSYAPALLPEANRVASALKDHFSQEGPLPAESDWLRRAISHPAGIVAEYWLRSLEIWRRHQEPSPATLGDEYSEALLSIVEDKKLSGTLGKAILGGAVSFLSAADYTWTREHLIPLFSIHANELESQAVWHGFIGRGQLNPEVAELMGESFLSSVSRIEGLFANSRIRRQYIRHYTNMVINYIQDPFVHWIPTFFSNASAEDRREFASSVGFRLQNMNDLHQRQVWEGLLKSYWEGRLKGVPPPPLDAAEIGAMLDWLPRLSGLFPEAVELATETPGASLEYSSLTYRLGEGNLWQEYPEATARLFIHLGQSEEGPGNWKWRSAKDLLAGLLQFPLPEDVKKALTELIAKLGLT